MPDLRFAFFDLNHFDDDESLRAAALITDEAGDPVEFRCTSPVKPTKLQKTLWGGRLDRYVASHLTGKALFDALKTIPAVIIVRKHEFLELRTLIEIPLIYVAENGASLPPKGLASEVPIESSDSLSAMIGEIPRLLVNCNHGDDGSRAIEQLRQCVRSFSLTEPFERIVTALEMVKQQEKGRPER